ncbi:MAG: EexN family lipoprotein [Vulcanimicrobiaceae bacterium]
MKRSITTGIALGVLVLSTACSPSTHTSQWYAAHPQEMKARIAACEQQGIAQSDQDCLNAQVAGLREATHGNSAGDPSR